MICARQTFRRGLQALAFFCAGAPRRMRAACRRLEEAAAVRAFPRCTLGPLAAPARARGPTSRRHAPGSACRPGRRRARRADRLAGRMRRVHLPGGIPALRHRTALRCRRRRARCGASMARSAGAQRYAARRGRRARCGASMARGGESPHCAALPAPPSASQPLGRAYGSRYGSRPPRHEAWTRCTIAVLQLRASLWRSRRLSARAHARRCRCRRRGRRQRRRGRATEAIPARRARGPNLYIHATVCAVNV